MFDKILTTFYFCLLVIGMMALTVLALDAWDRESDMREQQALEYSRGLK